MKIRRFIQSGRTTPLLMSLMLCGVILYAGSRNESDQLKNTTTTRTQSLSARSSYPGNSDSFWRWLSDDSAGFFTFVLCVVGIGQAGLFAWQLSVMRRGSKDSRLAAESAASTGQAAIAAQRPWLALEVKLASGLRLAQGLRYFGDNLIQIEISMTARNVGPTPALSVYSFASIVFWDTGGRPYNPLDLYLTPHLKEAERSAISDYGTAIFPGEEVKIERVAAERLAELKQRLSGAEPRFIAANLICYVSYVFDGGHGYTLIDAPLQLSPQCGESHFVLGEIFAVDRVEPINISTKSLTLGPISTYAR